MIPYDIPPIQEFPEWLKHTMEVNDKTEQFYRLKDIEENSNH
jgi:hypothetical protein